MSKHKIYAFISPLKWSFSFQLFFRVKEKNTDLTIRILIGTKNNETSSDYINYLVPLSYCAPPAPPAGAHSPTLRHGCRGGRQGGQGFGASWGNQECQGLGELLLLFALYCC